ncbi:MAG: hypothetical protein FWD84_04010, partial [Oscillospiraceae bacterium]|nr:hypothetical protein [Oscillospiraceae bacterium]
MLIALTFAILFTSVAAALPAGAGLAYYVDEYTFDSYSGFEGTSDYIFYPGEDFDFDIAFSLDDLDFLRQLAFDELEEIAPSFGPLSHTFLDPVLAMIPSVVVDTADPLGAIEDVMLELFAVLTQVADNGHTNFYNVVYNALFTGLRDELIAIRGDIDRLLGTGSAAARNNRLVNNLNARLNSLPTRLINDALNEIMDEVFGAIAFYHPGLLGRPGLIFDSPLYTFPNVRTRLNNSFDHMLNSSALLGAGESPQTIRNRLLTVTGAGTGMQVTRASMGGELADYVFAIVNYQQPRPHRPTRSYSVAQRRARLAVINNAFSAASINQSLNRSMTGWIMSRLDLQPFVVSSWQDLRAAINDFNVVPNDGTPVTLHIAAPDADVGIQGITVANSGAHSTWVNGRQGFTTQPDSAVAMATNVLANTITLHANQNVTLVNYRFDPDNPAVIVQNSSNATEGNRRHFNLAAANSFLTLDNVILKRSGTTTAAAATSRFFGGGVVGLPTGVAAIAIEENPETRRVHFENGGRILMGAVTTIAHLGPNPANGTATPGADTAWMRVPVNGVPVSIGIGGTISGLTSPATWTAGSAATVTNPNGSDMWLNGTLGLQVGGTQNQIRVPADGRHIVFTSPNPNGVGAEHSRILWNSTTGGSRRAFEVSRTWTRFSFENITLDSTTHPERIIGGITATTVPGSNANSRVSLLNGATIMRQTTGNSGGAINMTGTNIQLHMYEGSAIINNRSGAGGGAVIVGDINAGATNSAVFNMFGGVIADNVNNLGAGVDGEVAHRGLGGGVLVGPGNDTFNMLGGEIRNNHARFTNAVVATIRSSASGGGVAVDGHATFNWRGGRIHNNIANNGGAIAIVGTAGRTATVNIALEDWGEWTELDRIDPDYPYIPVFSGNHVPGNGGFFVMTHAGTGVLNIEGGGIIEGNSAGTARPVLIGNNGIPEGSPGSGIPTFEVSTGTTVATTGLPRRHGGAIAVTGIGTLNVDGAIIRNNEAFQTGGGVAVANTGTMRLLTDTVVEHNRAGSSIWAVDDGNFVQVPEHIVNPNGNGGGASVNLTTGSLVVASNAIIRNNAAQQHGGGLFSASNDPLVLDETMQIYGNEALTGNGGGIYSMGSGDLTMVYGSIHDNHAHNGYGGAIYKGGGGAFHLNGGTIRENSAQNGGGVYINSTAPISFTMGQLINVDGRLTMGTPAILGRPAAEDIFGGTIEHNEAAHGGGVFVNRGAFFMNNGAINNNRAVDGGGVYFASHTPVQARFT